MNTFVALCVLACACVFVSAELSPEQLEKINKAMETCKPKAGATDDDIEILMKHEVPTTKTGQCFVGCMNTELGLVKGGKFDVDHIKSVSQALKTKDADKYEKGMKVVETCAAEADKVSDNCEQAKVMMECCKKEAAASGIMMNAAR